MNTCVYVLLARYSFSHCNVSASREQSSLFELPRRCLTSQPVFYRMQRYCKISVPARNNACAGIQFTCHTDNIIIISHRNHRNHRKPCGMIILTQRRRGRRGLAENYRPAGSFASCRFIYFFCPAEIAEMAEIFYLVG
jgi:hypothetical protein